MPLRNKKLNGACLHDQETLEKQQLSANAAIK